MSFPANVLSKRCVVCDRAMVLSDPHPAHQECVSCPTCGSAFVVLLPIDLPRNRVIAQMRCMDCDHKWNGPNVVEPPKPEGAG